MAPYLKLADSCYAIDIIRQNSGKFIFISTYFCSIKYSIIIVLNFGEHKMDDRLGSALNQLDEELTRRSLNIEIVICGAYALHLLG